MATIETRKPTWIPRLAVGAEAVARYALYEVLEDLFVARLLALAQSRRHRRPTATGLVAPEIT